MRGIVIDNDRAACGSTCFGPGGILLFEVVPVSDADNRNPLRKKRSRFFYGEVMVFLFSSPLSPLVGPKRSGEKKP